MPPTRFPIAVLGAGLLALGAAGQAPTPDADVRWLEERSMLRQARDAAARVSGRPDQWRHPYGTPRPREAVRHASVWLLDYPGSVVTAPGRSVVATWADPALWDALRDLGIDLLHTGPVQRAGGVRGTEYTPTTDGWFDPVSLDLDPALGTEAEFARMVAVAAARKGSVAGDLVPLHTGLGPDFHLALRRHGDYPGMYTLVEIPKADWGLLPPVKDPWGVALVPRPAAEQLAKKGYIPGLIHSNDAAPEAKSWSGWSASGEVAGADGAVRRWVYLHSFKPTQPALNWLDPSYAARRVVAGGVVRNVVDRKARVLRLDAVPFLGIEPTPGTTDALHFKHPLSVVGTNDTAMMVRKLGGWTFHELNVPLKVLRAFTASGPDLSYDFATRAQGLHALLTGDAGPLRLAFRWMLEAGAQPVGFVHDLQNHDELTFQLTEPEGRKDESFAVGGRTLTGRQLKDEVLAAMRSKAAGDAAPYNHLYRPEKDGLATTFAGFVAPALGVKNPYAATPDQVREVARGHLLLAAANALLPGVFGVSSWDLVGALPVPLDAVKDRVGGGDFRWVNRGGVDLLGANPAATASASGLPRAKALYGPVPAQRKDPGSFASRLRVMLAARKKYRVAEGELLAAPEPKAAGVCVLVLKLPEYPLAVTVLNFGRADAAEDIDLGPAGRDAAGEWVDALTGAAAGPAAGGRLPVRLPALTGTTFVLSAARGPEKPSRWEQQAAGTDANLRGLSAVSPDVAWVSGTKGTVRRTTDGGRTWTAAAVAGAGDLDFRDIEAFGASTAYVLGAGPGDKSRVYKTTDGGKAWALQYTNPDPDGFLDAFAFWDDRTGIALGDPVGGRFQLVATDDGGANWKPLPAKNLPPALPGEAAFAASGTCLVTRGDRDVWFATGGGKVARVFRSGDRGRTWAVGETPVAAGAESAGVFSIAFRDRSHGVIVGGDHTKPKAAGAAAVTADGGKTWTVAGPLPYASGVAWAKDRWVAVGPAGSRVSHDGGATWTEIDRESYNSAAFTPAGDGWAVGANGRVAKFVK